MRYCVIKNTTTVIDGSLNTDDVMLQNASNAGFTAEQVEILTAEQYGARKVLEPQPASQISDAERITELEQIINMLLMGEM